MEIIKDFLVTSYLLVFSLILKIMIETLLKFNERKNGFHLLQKIDEIERKIQKLEKSIENLELLFNEILKINQRNSN